MELRASFDAWAHTEAGLTFQEMAQYTEQELARLHLGWLIRENPGSLNEDSDTLSKQRRKLRRGHRQQRQREFADLGIQ